ncbi:PEST proteolytic signal-containing nuclear protein-like [Saccostrea echinata]|uniref:PEST proteolytic signal-containing nuclear protein-like n=1 Tax=Saccostrea echinata TaxID=191078 RepID=UPI002A7F0588|nr:PEST proteolytic signal-containing nuclear protein-like [Saccostrea echinata]
MADQTEGTKFTSHAGGKPSYEPEKSPLEAGKPTIHSPEKRKASDEPSQPAKAQKFAMKLGSKSANKLPNTESANEKKAKAAPIKISLSSQPKEVAPILPKTKKIASVFNEEESDEEEEMPPEAKMRMKNVGRDTPTSTGPNSFGKGRLGFSDRNSLFQKEMLKQMNDVCDD